ncbi:MAG: transcription termination/antitermination protein NusG [Pirellulales bacterium]|nr:transcription termination/antitermination protein NusG [Pirellulales bacterium]
MLDNTLDDGHPRQAGDEAAVAPADLASDAAVETTAGASGVAPATPAMQDFENLTASAEPPLENAVSGQHPDAATAEVDVALDQATVAVDQAPSTDQHLQGESSPEPGFSTVFDEAAKVEAAANQSAPVDVRVDEHLASDIASPHVNGVDVTPAASTAEEADEPATIVVPTVKPRRTKTAAEYQEAMTALEEPPAQMHWYILKVATNREDSVCDTLRRKIAMAGLERYFGEIVVPVELITEFRNGKKRTTKRKLYPGYIVVNMEINDDTWYIVRETSGIGDFTGAMGRPTPMSAADIAKILPKTEDGPAEQPKVAIKYKSGDKVRIKEGNFINFEGVIEAIDEAKGRVTVMVNIFGRPTPVDIEYWLVEKVD